LIPIGIILILIGLFVAPLVYVFKQGFYFDLLVPLCIFILGIVLVGLGIVMRKLYISRIEKYINLKNINLFYSKEM
jgi:hypothetical protein